MPIFNPYIFNNRVFCAQMPTGGFEPNLSYWGNKNVLRQGRFDIPEVVEQVVTQQLEEGKSDDWAIKKLASELEMKVSKLRRERQYLEMLKAEQERQQDDENAVAVILAIA